MFIADLYASKIAIHDAKIHEICTYIFLFFIYIK